MCRVKCDPEAEPGLWIGEDYFEAIPLLRAVQSAGDSFVGVEIGAGWGGWGVNAVVAWHRTHPNHRQADCLLTLVEEDEKDLVQAEEHLQANGVRDFCRVSLATSRIASSDALDQLLQSLGRVDWFDMDIQGSEWSLILKARELSRIQHLFIGLHGRIIGEQIRQKLAHDFDIEHFFPSWSIASTPFGDVPFNDGVITGSRKHQ